jgi:hypothetical protein
MSGCCTDLNVHRTVATRGAAIPLGSESTLYSEIRRINHSHSGTNLKGEKMKEA